MCPSGGTLYDRFFIDEELNFGTVEAAVYLLLTDAASHELFVVADAVQRLWLLRRWQLKGCRVEGVAQHATDLALAAFCGMCRAEAFRREEAGEEDDQTPRLRELADAVNALHAKTLFPPAVELGAKDVHVALTSTRSAWFKIKPGQDAVRYIAAAQCVFSACAAVIERRLPERALCDHPGWTEKGNLFLRAFEEMEGACWGIMRSAYFLAVQARAPHTAAFALPQEARAAAVIAMATKIVPGLDSNQLAESVYQRYLDDAGEPGDCATYHRATAYAPCRGMEAVQYGRRAVYKEAMLILQCDPANMVRDAAWPPGTHVLVGRRISQLAREVVLVRAAAMYCSLQRAISCHVKSYADLELAEAGWWSPRDVACPCIVKAGGFWVLIESPTVQEHHTFDVVDAFCWLLLSLQRAETGQTLTLLQRLGIDVPQSAL